MKADDLREAFLSFFESKGCIRRPSDVLVPRWDPSVLFTPAGMNQFKDHFLGKCRLEFTRATTCQKCLRTGDIDNVGRTPRHHTFFEMLGNFSFGDYFKREAIHWAWEFLTGRDWLAIAPGRLTVSVYEADDEAYRIWSDEIGLASTAITRMGEDDNFWPASAPSQGPDGVCGPCSEIFYRMPDGSDVEIWNLVFTQYNRVGPPPDNLRPLPSRNIDTGMGLERTCAMLQGVDSNFHIDILRPLVEAVAEVCGRTYEPTTDDGRRMRRIADHLRACTFAIHENVLPGNNEEKYVVKRLLRRAVLDGRQLGVSEPFLHHLPPVVADLMRRPYPELTETTERVATVIRREEESFLATIDSGLERIERLFVGIARSGGGLVRGADAAELYTTYGFPPEMLEALAAERNCAFDWNGFREAMEAHGQRSGAGSRTEVFATGPLDSLRKAVHGCEFVGYDTTAAPARVIGIIARDRLCESLRAASATGENPQPGDDEPVTVVLDQTPFYGESGGQVGDSGWLEWPSAAGDSGGEGSDTPGGSIGRFEVLDTQRSHSSAGEGSFVLHIGHLRSGTLGLGAEVSATVDPARRAALRRAHSATHLLHASLQRHLGSHAVQQGSKVEADHLRFDFSHPTSLDESTLRRIEDEVNANVLAALPVSASLLPLAEARHAGAMMLFGEKYPDVVRMVTMDGVSRELCGGTHVANTGQIGLVRIVSEESVAAGTRRIQAMTGLGVLERLRRAESIIADSAGALRVPAADLVSRIASIQKEVKDLRKGKGREAATTPVDELIASATTIDGVRVIVAQVGGDAAAMRQSIDHVRRKGGPVAVLLAGVDGSKVTLVAGISEELQERGLSATDWLQQPATLVGGRGGGRKDLAQAGGRIAEAIPAALTAARESMQRLLSS
jgi:alanyl-tRNA synthetase